ncbi:hypothetical protein WJ0W_000808 [Paenibacillus melissococcoides]|uniref:Uncharacterized protein n=1 Tax=Paenibacillus melissococcoides TaxID=2912268 RepID=A0ABM9FWL5_9BACL|nr:MULTISPECIES: hypothetical protein [Paenibacillus]MEB9896133.1 hypothetical protein [Bacillus cereus]CAH8243568.1 hypothetical protein WJ0W_000808 [Paenibacillus melissococcoides]CAH8704893.1 hypothetical protein WDD9_000793 [Paenibacillus melissococcoides]CAH8708117.1 hypothetical protein HTL2_001879 [Paenibacillus melissococcoides]GIO79933.1 hypothetical protein J6TS7_35430 [Paenibacillus dendritiformis]
MTTTANTEIVAERDIELYEENIKLGFQKLNNLFKQNPYLKEVLWKSLAMFFQRKATVADKDINEYIEDIFGEHTGQTIASLLADRNSNYDEYLTDNREYFIALKNSFYFDFTCYAASLGGSPFSLTKFAPASNNSKIVRISRADGQYFDVEINENNIISVMMNISIYLESYFDKSDFDDRKRKQIETLANQLKTFATGDDHE